MKNKLYIKLPIEDDPIMLQEYGRATILTNNLEYFLKNKIIVLGGKILKNKPTLGDLIENSKGYLPKKIIAQFKNLNKSRIKLIHGTLGTAESHRTNKKWHFILNNGKFTPIGIKFIKKYSELARNLLQKLSTL